MVEELNQQVRELKDDVSNLTAIKGEHPKVCVNLQTDVR